ncbi:MAG: type IX secretion system membrane protein PorP/SprF [Salibacteraceae bacterium]
MKLIKAILFFSLFFASHFIKAQTPLGQYEVYKIMQFYNPAYAGVKADMNFVFQSEYYSVDNYILHFQADGRLGLFDSIKNLNPSLGILYRNDELGLVNKIHFGISVSNTFEVKGGHKLSAGIRYDYINTKIDKDDFVTPVGFSIGDPTINETKTSGNSHVGGVGLYFESKKKLLNGSLSFDYRGIFNSDLGPGQNILSESQVVYYNASVGTQLKVGQFYFLPTLFTRFEHEDFEILGSAKLFFKELIYLGGGYIYKHKYRYAPIGEFRLNEQYMLMAGGRFKMKKVGTFELGVASYFPKANPVFENGFQVYLNYFLLRKNSNQVPNLN